MASLSIDTIQSQSRIALDNLVSSDLEKQRDALLLIRKLLSDIPDPHLNILFADELFKKLCFCIQSYEENIAPLSDDEFKDSLINQVVLSIEVLAECWKRYRTWIAARSTGLQSFEITHLPGIITFDESIRSYSNDQVRAAIVRVISVFASPEIPSDRELVKSWLSPMLQKHPSPSVRFEALRILNLFGLIGSIPADRQGLHRIAGYDDTSHSLDIVFIHGLGGDSWTSWMANLQDLGTFWPSWIAADFPQARIWTLGYAASASKWEEESMPIADRGNQIIELFNDEGIGRHPIIFITHSMGGIVVKQLLRNAESYGVRRWKDIPERTIGIAFISTPHSGAQIASFVDFARVLLRTNETVSELQQHHSRLRDLHRWFLDYQRRQQVVCRTYCETREVRPEVPIFGVKLPKGILVVDQTSAEPNIPGEVAIPLDEDHISICKPSSRQSQIYKGISRFVNECL